MLFDIPYNVEYSTTIEFNTQINEKQKGFEQRYPVWTYPKRIFSLEFEKDPKGRELLEQFIIEMQGQNGKFDWVWDAEKGGDGQTYECWLDTDTLRQNIKHFGFTKTTLNLVTIDKAPVENLPILDIEHNAECENSIEFFTLVDKIFTARNDRKSYWDVPKKSWMLTFEKTPGERRKLESFFKSKRGKFKAFKWVWAKDKGGDDKEYTVRFDTDTLDSRVSAFGFGQLQIPIKEVFVSENPYTEIETDEIIPRNLLEIELSGGSVYILDNETLESLDHLGTTFMGAPLEFSDIKKDDNSAMSKIEITLSNVALGISAIIGVRGDVITGAPALIRRVFLNVNTNQVITENTQILWAGKCNNVQLDYENAKMDIETPLGGYEIMSPAAKYRPTCQVRRFKDTRCKYSGEETNCDRTWERCKELGNQSRFQGFISLPNQLLIKA